MICNNIIDSNHLFERKNSYIVDTNVLLGLYGNKQYVSNAQRNPKLVIAMSNFNKAIDYKCKIFVPSIVISEFANRYFSKCFKELQKSDTSKKFDKKRDYRDTHLYERDAKYLEEVFKTQIFSVASPISDEFGKIKLDEMFKFDNEDFNDRLLKYLSNQTNAYLISGDKDIKNMKIK